MNIFANKFCITLLTKESFRGVNFGTLPLEDIQAKLDSRELDFSSQVFYCNAEKEPFLAGILYELATDITTHALECKVVVIFKDVIGLKEFLKVFRPKFKKLLAGGGTPVNKDGKVLLIFRHGLWDLAKGKRDKGEKMKDCAWREVMEETNLKSHKIGPKLDSTYHIFKGRKGWTLKKTYWYFMPVEKKENLKPQFQESITDLKWVKLSKLAREMPDTYPLIKEVLREVIFRFGEV